MHDEQAEAVSITERQLQVLELLDRRVPIKIIASDLGISQSRVNQHIAALKRSFQVNDLADLVSAYRQQYSQSSPSPLRNPACTKSHLPNRDGEGHSGFRVADSDLVLADAAFFPLEAPWAESGKPVVVPGVLNGRHAVVRRLGAMLGMAIGMLAAVVLVIMAAVTIGDLLDGVAEIPEEQLGADG